VRLGAWWRERGSVVLGFGRRPGWKIGELREACRMKDLGVGGGLLVALWSCVVLVICSFLVELRFSVGLSDGGGGWLVGCMVGLLLHESIKRWRGEQLRRLCGILGVLVLVTWSDMGHDSCWALVAVTSRGLPQGFL